MNHSGNSAVGDKQESFIFCIAPYFQFIQQIIDSLSKSQHGLAAIIIRGKLLFCLVENSGMLFPFVAFVFSKVLLNKAWFQSKWQPVFFCKDFRSISSAAQGRIKNFIYLKSGRFDFFCKLLCLLNSFEIF